METVDHQAPQHRGRTLAGTVLAALLVAAWLLAAGVLGGGPSATSPPAAGSGAPGSIVPVASSSYVVQPGDTLWSVARRLSPDGDVRPLVDHLDRQTGGRPLRVGQRIPLS